MKLKEENKKEKVFCNKKKIEDKVEAEKSKTDLIIKI